MLRVTSTALALGVAVLVCAFTLRPPISAAQSLPIPGAPASPSEASHDADALAEMVARLGADEYTVRDSAMREIMALGPDVSPRLERALRSATDPEVRFRLRYILEYIAPPQRAAMVVSPAPGFGLRPGDLITHVNGRRIRTASEVRQLLDDRTRGARITVRGLDGPRDLTTLTMLTLGDPVDFVAPRGVRLAQSLRHYSGGRAERAYEELRAAGDVIPGDEFPVPLRARIAYTAGDAPAAFELLSGWPEVAAPLLGDWDSESPLDVAGPGKAPYYLEWRLLTEGRLDSGRPMYETANDRDLRIQRILVPGNSYMQALARATQIWHAMRSDLALGGDPLRIAGNQLAVCGWMLYELGLRSECCRMIEPRSKILRATPQRLGKWVRVETDAWLPLLGGSPDAAVDAFHEHAMEILRRPPQPREGAALIRSPQIAARHALFLFIQNDEQRLSDALAIVNVQGHVGLPDYAHWMLMALRPANEPVIRRHLHAMLPTFPDEAALPFARAAAILEYLHARPQDDVFIAARQRIVDSADRTDRDVWLAIVDALRRLAAGQPEAARQTLEAWRDHPDAAALLATARFLSDPPDGALRHDALRTALLATPIDAADEIWTVLARDRRWMFFDSRSGALSLSAAAPADWTPNPLTWPWIGCEADSGRAWLYELRRVTEITPDREPRLRMNIQTEELASFHRYASRCFGALADAVMAAPRPAGETGEFLQRDVRAEHGLTTDPSLPELGFIRPAPQDARIVQISMRGGPDLLLDVSSDRCWSSAWIRRQAGLQHAPRLFAEALWPTAASGTNAGGTPALPVRDEGRMTKDGEPPSASNSSFVTRHSSFDPVDRLKTGPIEPPVLMLLTDQGLIRFDVGAERLERIALPGETPYPALVPESTPYLRRDPAWFYVARLPEDGGEVYRLALPGGEIEPLPMVNLALPPEYFAAFTRAALREEVNRRFAALDLPDLDTFILETETLMEQWERLQGVDP